MADVSHCLDMSVSAMLVTSDDSLSETVYACAEATGCAIVVAHEPAEVRRRWARAPLVLIGWDCASWLVGMALDARTGVHLLGRDATEVVQWSAPLGASALLLPEQQGYLAALLDNPGATSADDGSLLRMYGGSGGVGTSTLAAGLAVRAARRGLATALVELDPWGGGIDILFGAEHEPGWRWPELIHASGHIADLEAHLPQGAGVDLVSMARTTADMSDVDGPPDEAVQAVLRSLRRTHALVVVDQGRIAPEGSCVLVVAAQVRSVLATKSIIHAKELADAQLIVREGPAWRLPGPLIAETLDLPLCGVFRHDQHLAQGLEVGDPPGRASGAVAKNLDQLLDALPGIPNSHTPSRSDERNG
jgi:secretion/DNA translocation related CpaE-like protein